MKKKFIYSLVSLILLTGCDEKAAIKDSVVAATAQVKEDIVAIANEEAEVLKDSNVIINAVKISSVIDTATKKVSEVSEVAESIVKDTVAVTVQKSENISKEAKVALAGISALAISSSADATIGSQIYKRCASYHGANGEKKALGTGKIITGWNSTKTIEAMMGYKDVPYSGAMKNIMKTQVAQLSEVDIANVAAYIATFK